MCSLWHSELFALSFVVMSVYLPVCQSLVKQVLYVIFEYAWLHDLFYYCHYRNQLYSCFIIVHTAGMFADKDVRFYRSEMLYACDLCVCQRFVYMNKFHGRISTCLNHVDLRKYVSACSPQNLCTMIKYCNNTKTVKRFWHNWSGLYNVNLIDIWPHETNTSSVTVTLTGQLNEKQSV